MKYFDGRQEKNIIATYYEANILQKNTSTRIQKTHFHHFYIEQRDRTDIHNIRV